MALSQVQSPFLLSFSSAAGHTKPLLSLPMVLIFHCPNRSLALQLCGCDYGQQQIYRFYPLFANKLHLQLYNLMSNLASQFKKVMPSVSNEKIRVVYPPCNVDSLNIINGGPISRKQRPPNSRYVFLSMNRFWPEKRLDIILDAASSFYFQL